jgi:transcription antitermination factor NusG
MEQTLNWYAVYTRSRFEKRSAQLLSEQNIEAYVTLKRVVRMWSDRRKLFLEHLIRSYVFVKVNPLQYNKLLSIDGVVRYIWFNGKPAVIPEKQINILKAIAGTDTDVECIPHS